MKQASLLYYTTKALTVPEKYSSCSKKPQPNLTWPCSSSSSVIDLNSYNMKPEVNVEQQEQQQHCVVRGGGM